VPLALERSRGADCTPDAFGCCRQIEMGDAEWAECVDDGVHDRGEGANIAGLARPLTPNGLVLVRTGFSSISKDGTSSARGRP